MKKLLSGLFALGLWLGLLAPSFAVVTSTLVNNAAYTILGTDVRVVTGPTAFTASRTWTLPDAGQTCIGQNCQPAAQALVLLDNGNAISLAFPLVIAPASGNTINGSSAPITIVLIPLASLVVRRKPERPMVHSLRSLHPLPSPPTSVQLQRLTNL